MARMLTKAGRYQIVSELGRGSMGVVYQGFDPVIGRTVAIKTMLIEGLSTAEFQEYKTRFQREAQAAGILAHPNIVTVYDFGEDEGVLFLAMEYLEGKSLQAIVEKQHILPLETIVPMFDQVCSALDHAHTHKIVHRDIKPANIMILDSGLVKVTDFGIAKMMSMGMTQAGQVLGTPNYMSPEQVKGRAVDGRSDIFSLGVILYELVTGEKPFGGQNITTVIYKIINENPIPPRELDATIHPGLSYVIQKSLAKSPEERYQTCRELADDLKNYRSLGGATAPSETVVIKVPPIQPAAPLESRQPPAAVSAGPVAPPPAPQSAPVQRARPAAPPPAPVAVARPAAPKSSSTVWIVLAILLIGALGGGGYYFLYIRPQGNTPATSSAPGTGPTAQTSPVNATNPATTSPSTAVAPATPAGGAGPATPTPIQPTPATAPAVEKPAASKYATLAIKSDPDGAQITIDGKSDPGWITPRIFDTMDPGSHNVILSKEGYKTARQRVRVKAGRTEEVSLNLAELRPPAQPAKRPATRPAASTPTPPPSPSTEQPETGSTGQAPGILTVRTKPPGLEIMIDGKSWGNSPAEKSVAPGEHKITVRENGVEIYNTTVEVKPASMITKIIALHD
jgi:eukaryotic-like serine/threonine-protein kinase